MAFIGDKTNKECSYFWGAWWDGREQKVGFAEQQLRLWHTGLNRVRRQVGELPFCVFAAGIIWRRDDPMSLW